MTSPAEPSPEQLTSLGRALYAYVRNNQDWYDLDDRAVQIDGWIALNEAAMTALKNAEELRLEAEETP